MRPDAPSPRVPVSIASWPASARADQWHRTTESPARLPGTLRRFPGFNVGVSSAGPATGHCRANDLQSHIGCGCIFFFFLSFSAFRFLLLFLLFQHRSHWWWEGLEGLEGAIFIRGHADQQYSPRSLGRPTSSMHRRLELQLQSHRMRPPMPSCG